jgi:SAM-dependent methyltransferase
MSDSDKHDWEIIAARDPWFGVLNVEEFRNARIDDAARQRFYQSGESEVGQVLGWFDADLGARPSGHALDIGSGLGRLSRAMAKTQAGVTGYDISDTMVRLAADGAPANCRFTTQLPDGPFDWINSFIVFQHIPPAEGLALIERALARTAPRAFISLQITGWRSSPAAPASPLATFRKWRNRRVHRTQDRPVDALIGMHDYNFSDVLQRVTAAGFSRIVLRHTNHGEHHGAWILSRRDQ